MIRRKNTTTETTPNVISEQTTETSNTEVPNNVETKPIPKTRTRVAKVTLTKPALEQINSNEIINEEVSAITSDINPETPETMKDSDKEKVKKTKSKEKDKKAKEKKKAKAKKDKQKDKEKKRKAKKKEKAKKAKAKDKAKAKKKEKAKKKSKAKSKSKKKK